MMMEEYVLPNRKLLYTSSDGDNDANRFVPRIKRGAWLHVPFHNI